MSIALYGFIFLSAYGQTSATSEVSRPELQGLVRLWKLGGLAITRAEFRSVKGEGRLTIEAKGKMKAAEAKRFLHASGYKAQDQSAFTYQAKDGGICTIVINPLSSTRSRWFLYLTRKGGAKSSRIDLTKNLEGRYLYSVLPEFGFYAILQGRPPQLSSSYARFVGRPLPIHDGIESKVRSAGSWTLELTKFPASRLDDGWDATPMAGFIGVTFDDSATRHPTAR